MGPPPYFLNHRQSRNWSMLLVAVLLEGGLVEGLLLGEPARARRCDRPVPLAVDVRDAVQELGFVDNLVVAEEVPRVRAALVADLEEFLGLAARQDHLLGLLEVVRHLLLAVDVQAGLHARDGMLGVHPVGGGHDDRLQALLLLEHLLVIGVERLASSCRRRLSPDDAGGVFLGVRPDVADGLEPDALDLRACSRRTRPCVPPPMMATLTIVAGAGPRRLVLGQDGGGQHEARAHAPVTFRKSRRLMPPPLKPCDCD